MQVRRVDCTTATALLFTKSHSLSFDGGSFLSSTRNSPRRADPLVPRVAAFDGHVVVASASSARYDGRRADDHNALEGDDASRWRIWSVIEELETNGISSSSLYRPDDAIDDNLDDNGRVAVVVSAELIDRVI